MLALLLSAMAGIVTGVAAQENGAGRLPSAIGFGVMAAILWFGAARSLLLGVFAKPHAVVMRGLTRTTTIPWKEIEKISGGAPTGGASGMAGATTAVITRKRQGKPADEVELNVLGGYGIFRRRPSLADRAAQGLNKRLAEWRATEKSAR
ncbi:MAG TPA: hypothetical protein VF062_18535 [Candidatus Limnocylindrales bacterium]